MSMSTKLTKAVASGILAAFMIIPGSCWSEVHLVLLPDEGGLPTIGVELDKAYSVSAIQINLSGSDPSVIDVVTVQHPEAYSSFFNLTPTAVNLFAPGFSSDLDYQSGVLVKWHLSQGTNLALLTGSIVGYPFQFVSGTPPLQQDNMRLVPEPSSGLMLLLGIPALGLLATRSLRSRA